MVLTLDFADFGRAVRRYLEEPLIYLSPYRTGSLLTAADPARNLLLRSITGLHPEEAHAALAKDGFEASAGTWSSPEAGEEPVEITLPLHVAAVAYASGDGKPGLWVDASEEPPTLAQVLRTMYDEFVGNGEVVETSLEGFIEAANPNVVILAPSDLERFARQKQGC